MKSKTTTFINIGMYVQSKMGSGGVMPFFALIFLVLILGMSPTHAHADTAFKHRLTVFSGKYTTKSMARTFDLLSVEYENNYLVAAAYGRDIIPVWRDLLLGPEIGAACRFGDRTSLEIWGGVFLRHKGATIGRSVTIEPALTLGLSAIDKAIGIERTRQETQDGNARVLFYLGPEVAFSFPRNEQWAVVYRLHHRSGGFRVLGNLKGGHNANTLGIRYRF